MRNSKRHKILLKTPAKKILEEPLYLKVIDQQKFLTTQVKHWDASSREVIGRNFLFRLNTVTSLVNAAYACTIIPEIDETSNKLKSILLELITKWLPSVFADLQVSVGQHMLSQEKAITSLQIYLTVYQELVNWYKKLGKVA